MGLAPSENPENSGKSVVAKVPVPIFSQPRTAMSLSREDVAKVSLLGRLRLRDDELDRMTDQLTQIVAYMELLSEVNTDGVEPMAHAVERSNVFAGDLVVPSLDRDAALSNAPKRDEQCYRVPAVLGD
jgi:aspartyl-tRNA(Asn)/glutamyl-tRNA(Gln) amidotransferase subunit C